MNTPTEIRIRDLYLASYLLASGVNYLQTEWVNPRQAEFVFAPEDRDEIDLAEQLRRAWINQTGEINATRYAASIRQLKNEVHSGSHDRDEPPVVERRRIVGTR